MNNQLDRAQIKGLRDLRTYIDMARTELNELNSAYSQTMLALQHILRIVGIKCEELADGMDRDAIDSDMDSEVESETLGEGTD